MKPEYHSINWNPMGGVNVLDAGDYLLITKSGKPVEFHRTFAGGFVITIDGQRYETDWNTEASAIMNKFEVGGVLKPVFGGYLAVRRKGKNYVTRRMG